MDLLDFGMKNQNSKSPVKKAAAKGALQIARLQADMYEHYLEKEEIPLPEDPDAAEAMLKRIQDELEKQPENTHTR